MKKIFIGTRNFLFPGKWNELTAEQLLYIAELLSADLSKQEIVVMLTVYFSGLSIKELQQFNPAIFIELEHQYDFIFKDVKIHKNLFHEIKVRLKKFYGYDDALANMTYEQFIIFAETYFMAYIQSSEQRYLDLLIASLYTRRKNEFIPDQIKENAEKLKHLSNAYKVAIFLNYQGNRSYLASRFPKLFASQKNTKNKNDLNFIEVIELLNNGDVSKNNEIKKINIYEVFTRLTNLIKENEQRHHTTIH